MRRPLGLWLCAVLCAATAGCPGPEGKAVVSSRPPRPVAVVDVIYIDALPVAMNWDEKPGPDGLEAQVHFYRMDQPLPVTVSGTLELLLFEGKVSAAAAQANRPFHTWSFTTRELAGTLRKDLAGWGYAMRLAWGSPAPAAGMVTLIGRYQASGGEWVYSSPVAVATEAN